MKKIVKIISILLMLGSVFTVTGCMSLKAGVRDPGVTIDLQRKEFEILGRVTVEKDAVSVLGIGPFGGVSYGDLYDKAANQYPGFDDIVNIYTDMKVVNVGFLYSNLEVRYSGLAIKYKK